MDQLDPLYTVLDGWLEPASVFKWLYGVNAHLANRRPIDLLRQGDVAAVVRAAQADRSGAFA